MAIPSQPDALFLTSEAPFPADTGGKTRENQFIQILKEQMNIEVLCFATSPAPDTSGVRISMIERTHPALWRRAVAPLQTYMLNGYSERMAEAIKTRAAPRKLIWVSSLQMAQYIPLARKLGYRIILDEHDLITYGLVDKALSSLKNLPSLWTAAQHIYFKGRFCLQTDAIVTTTDIAASRLLKLAPGTAVHVIPHSVDSSRYTSIRNQPGSTLLFPANGSPETTFEGLSWFVAEVLPRLRAALGAKLPRIVVAMTSTSSPAWLTEAFGKELHRAGIEIQLAPTSLAPQLAEAAVVFIPTRSDDANTRVSILEAMASGRGVVSTATGVEGLVLAPGYDIFIAERADGFTTAILKLLQNPQERAQVGARAAETIEKRYDWRCARPMMHELVRSLAQSE